MRASVRRHPASRLKALGGLLVTIALFVGLVSGLELLRHPAPEDQPLPPAAGDPRDELVCPDPPPREDRPREEDDMVAVQAVGSGELYDCPQSFDGASVRYRGEVVGAVLWRRDGAWVQLNDDIYADADTLGPLPTHRVFRGGNSGIGVFLSREAAEQIAFVGGPRYQGDIVEVVGRFHRIDPETVEVTIVRAEQAEIVQQGNPLEPRPLRDRQVVAAILIPLALALTLIDRRAAQRV